MIERSPLSLVDDIGVVYIAPDRVLRAINDAKLSEVSALLDSGLIDALTQARLFPRTTISSSTIPGHTLVLEHELISPTTYPSEWSPEMLRLAGQCVLLVNEIASTYGYELKDAHPHNLMFHGLQPVFVDFGSLIPIDQRPGWPAENEFRQCYLRPLALYREGLHWSFKRAFLGDGGGIPLQEYLLLRCPALRHLGQRLLLKLVKYWRAYKNPRILTSQLIEEELRSDLLRCLARFVSHSKWLPFRQRNQRRLAKKLAGLKPTSRTTWGDYHSELIGVDGKIKLTPRLQRITEIVSELQPSTVLDIAGNQGALARSLARLPSVEQVICTDYDERAIDLLVERSAPDERICPVAFNLMGDSSPAEIESRQTRLRCDLVLALAVTHHLILSQKFALTAILETLGKFSRCYVLVEFMPLGLHNGENAPPLPDWYSADWFEAGMQQAFDIVGKETLEDNRVLYIGKHRTSSSP